jgi:purine-binding chemotaxis protein CheW
MEIIEMIKITPMPESNSYVEGVINLRGKVIPVMNVRKRFSMAHKDWDDRTCIIVVKVREMEIGLIVDTVAEVMDIPAEQIQPPPDVQQRKEQRFIMGMGKIGSEVNILLDLESLLFDENDKSIIEN